MHPRTLSRPYWQNPRNIPGRLTDVPEAEPQTIVERIACEMIRLNAEGGGATFERLFEAGFSGSDLAEHGDAARALANSMFLRKLDEEAPPYNREARIDDAADIVGGILPDQPQAILMLRNHGYGPRELGDLWPEITNRLRERVGSLLAPLQVQ